MPTSGTPPTPPSTFRYCRSTPGVVDAVLVQVDRPLARERAEQTAVGDAVPVEIPNHRSTTHRAVQASDGRLRLERVAVRVQKPLAAQAEVQADVVVAVAVPVADQRLAADLAREPGNHRVVRVQGDEVQVAVEGEDSRPRAVESNLFPASPVPVADQRLAVRLAVEHRPDPVVRIAGNAVAVDIQHEGAGRGAEQADFVAGLAVPVADQRHAADLAVQQS